MPNPIRLKALNNAKAYFRKKATQRQRISLAKVGEKAPRHIVELPEPPIRLEVGDWIVLHETLLGGKWVKGRGLRVSDYRAKFDDNPEKGDNDFNDAIVTFQTDT